MPCQGPCCCQLCLPFFLCIRVAAQRQQSILRNCNRVHQILHAEPDFRFQRTRKHVIRFRIPRRPMIRPFPVLRFVIAFWYAVVRLLPPAPFLDSIPQLLFIIVQTPKQQLHGRRITAVSPVARICQSFPLFLNSDGEFRKVSHKCLPSRSYMNDNRSLSKLTYAVPVFPPVFFATIISVGSNLQHEMFER